MLAAALLLGTSCDDKLSALPTQSKVDGNLVVDQKSAEYALNGIYYRYAMCQVDNYAVESTGCATYYEIYPANAAGLVTYYQGPYMFETHGGSGYTSYSSYYWSAYYQQLTAANSVIDQVGKADDSWFTGNRKTEIIAEARCMRALINYNILRMFGYFWDVDSLYGIILRLDPTKSSTLSVPRSSVSEAYRAIMEDLDYAIENMVETSANHYTNRWVAKGLKVRVLMMRGQGSDYADAASLAEEIIAQGPYRLEEHTTDIFHVKGLTSAEVMFGIQPKDNQTNVLEAYHYRGEAQYVISDKFAAFFENDPRKDELMKVDTVDVPTYNYIFDEAGNLTGYELVYVKTPMTSIFKHMPPGELTATTTEESQYQMRLGEMYLLRAEALARENRVSEAKELLKTVMSKAGVTDFSEVDNVSDGDVHAFMEVYFKEYMRNLFCESGREWEIMMRLPQDIVVGFNPEYANTQYSVFPIPDDEFRNNYALTRDDQNPGYSVAGLID